MGADPRNWSSPWRRRQGKLLAALALVLGSDVCAGAGLPTQMPFERYGPLARSPLFTAATFTVPFFFQSRDWRVRPRDLYIERSSRTPEGDIITLRSMTDPTFSMTITQKPPKLTPPKK